jgi:hypothetical protein
MSNDSNNRDNPTIYPSVDAMVADALSVVETEILKYKSKVKQGRSLEPNEAKILQGYIKSLVDLSREDRERAKESDLSKLSTEELVQLLGNKKPQLPEGKK